MRFLVDNALSPRVADGLNKGGQDALHVQAYGMHDADDVDIFLKASPKTVC